MRRLDSYVREYRLRLVLTSPADIELDRKTKDALPLRLAIECWVVDLDARPEPSLPPLVLDLVALFREVHAEE